MNEQRISFANSRGDTLVGVLHHAASDRIDGAVILCHGMESDRNSEKLIFLGRHLAQRGILTLRFDFSYVGESSAKFEDITYRGEVDDLQAAYALMQNRHSGKISIFGSSMGGTVALTVAALESRVTALATLAAPLHPEHFPKRVLSPAGLERWRKRGFTLYNGQRLNLTLLEDLESIDVPNAARRIHCPVLILHGDGDEVVPMAEAHELHDCLANSKRLSLLKDGDHRLSDPIIMQRAMREALDWLTEHVQ
jgi:pimeloyl-ACP methyl ester carboxylesterase